MSYMLVVVAAVLAAVIVEVIAAVAVVVVDAVVPAAVVVAAVVIARSGICSTLFFLFIPPSHFDRRDQLKYGPNWRDGGRFFLKKRRKRQKVISTHSWILSLELNGQRT